MTKEEPRKKTLGTFIFFIAVLALLLVSVFWIGQMNSCSNAGSSLYGFGFKAKCLNVKIVGACVQDDKTYIPSDTDLVNLTGVLE